MGRVNRTYPVKYRLISRFLYKLEDGPGGVKAKVFKWTGRNQYFALCESGFVSFGGG